MSDALQHECGIALVRLLKPLEFYKEKYGTAFYGIQKMYLLMEKQHNRGQDGAGFASINLIWNQVKDILVECDQMLKSKMCLLR
jgi:amidophosphoribosyltransferase